MRTTNKNNKLKNGITAFPSSHVTDKQQEKEALPITGMVVMSQEELVSFCDRLINARLPAVCKQFCYENRHQYRCTVDSKWGVSENEAPLCEWGNAGYTWMLKELCNQKRINRLDNPGRDNVMRYLGKIINSTPFRERFKDWRFQRRVRIPDYIKFLDPDASRIFWWLYDGDNISNIAQRLGRSDLDIQALVKTINVELHKRKKGYLLKHEEVVSLNSLSKPDNDIDEFELPARYLSDEELDLRGKVSQAYNRLTWQEQFVLDAMVVDELSAKSVLKAIQEQNISINDKIPVAELTDQNVYYFLRKVISKLKTLSGVD